MLKSYIVSFLANLCSLNSSSLPVYAHLATLYCFIKLNYVLQNNDFNLNCHIGKLWLVMYVGICPANTPDMYKHALFPSELFYWKALTSGICLCLAYKCPRHVHLYPIYDLQFLLWTSWRWPNIAPCVQFFISLIWTPNSELLSISPWVWIDHH